MTDITENSVFPLGIYQVDLNTRIIGGAPTYSSGGVPIGGFANVGLQQLANRTRYLKDGQDVSNANIEALDTLVNQVSESLSQHIGTGGSSHPIVTVTDAGFMSASDKTKLNGIETGAQVNKNTIASIAVSGQTTVLSALEQGTVEFIGSGITITTDNTTKSVTFTSNGIPTTGGTFTGPIVGTKAIFNQFVDNTNTSSTNGITPTILSVSDYSVFDVTLDTNVSFQFNNTTRTGTESISFVVRIRQDSVQRTVTWPMGIQWLTPGGAIPATPAAGKIVEYIFTLSPVLGSSSTEIIGRVGATT